MAKRHTATLIGGSCAGMVVEIVGAYCTGRKFRSNRGWFEERYLWERGEGDSLLGRFAGYYDRNGRVDKLGRRLTRRSSAGTPAS